MKKIILILLLFSVLKYETASAKDFGLGIILGAPSAVTGKFWLDSTAAVDVGLAFNLSSYFLLYADYLYHFHKAFGGSSRFVSQLSPYVGVGGVGVITNSSRSDDEGFYGRNSGAFGLGIRIPLGIEWRPSTPRLGVFVELAPGLSAIPRTSGFIQGGVGARYFF